MADDYVCGGCGAVGVQLWRQYQSLDFRLRCEPCAERDQGTPRDGDAIGWYVPAIPTADGAAFWGFTSAPADRISWWRALPSGRGRARPADERHHAAADAATEEPMKGPPVVPVRGEPQPCPGCGKTLNAIACPEGELPVAGDWSVCYACAAVLRFTGEGFRCRLALPSELEAAIAAGGLDPDDGDLLRHAFAQRHGGGAES